MALSFQFDDEDDSLYQEAADSLLDYKRLEVELAQFDAIGLENDGVDDGNKERLLSAFIDELFNENAKRMNELDDREIIVRPLYQLETANTDPLGSSTDGDKEIGDMPPSIDFASTILKSNQNHGSSGNEGPKGSRMGFSDYKNNVQEEAKTGKENTNWSPWNAVTSVAKSVLKKVPLRHKRTDNDKDRSEYTHDLPSLDPKLATISRPQLQSYSVPSGVHTGIRFTTGPTNSLSKFYGRENHRAPFASYPRGPTATEKVFPISYRLSFATTTSTPWFSTSISQSSSTPHTLGNITAPVQPTKKRVRTRPPATVCLATGMPLTMTTVSDQPESESTFNEGERETEKVRTIEEALDMYKLSLRIQRNIFGHNHKSNSRTLRNMAILLRMKRMLDESLSLFHESLEITQNALGEYHFSVASTYRQIALLLVQQSKLEDALVFYEKSLDIYIKICGEFHVKVAAVYGDIAFLLKEQGRMPDAKQMLLISMKIKQRLRMEPATYGDFRRKLLSRSIPI